MSGEGFQHQEEPIESNEPLFLSEIERETVEFSQNNAAIKDNLNNAAERAEYQRQVLESWCERGVAVPVKGWARDYADAPSASEAATPIKLRYSDEGPHEEIGGWTPPDRYLVLEVHNDAVEGTMAWIAPSIDRAGRRYNVLARLIEFVDDTDIRKYWDSAVG